MLLHKNRSRRHRRYPNPWMSSVENLASKTLWKQNSCRGHRLACIVQPNWTLWSRFPAWRCFLHNWYEGTRRTSATSEVSGSSWLIFHYFTVESQTIRSWVRHHFKFWVQ
jgi:hypothetical protein